MSRLPETRVLLAASTGGYKLNLPSCFDNLPLIWGTLICFTLVYRQEAQDSASLNLMNQTTELFLRDCMSRAEGWGWPEGREATAALLNYIEAHPGFSVFRISLKRVERIDISFALETFQCNWPSAFEATRGSVSQALPMKILPKTLILQRSKEISHSLSGMRTVQSFLAQDRVRGLSMRLNFHLSDPGRARCRLCSSAT